VQKWRHKSCVYCGKSATTSDHVPPKLLLERPLPTRATTVPACHACNGGFSLDEQYFWVLLGQVSPSPAIAEKVSPGGAIDRTLQRSPKLEERLGRTVERTAEGADIYIQVEHNRINRVLGKIALGLYFARYGRSPPAPGINVIGAYLYTMQDSRPLGLIVSTHNERFRPKRWSHVQRGVFSYIFVRDPRSYGHLICVMDFHQTLWGAVRLAQPRKRKATSGRQIRLLD